MEADGSVYQFINLSQLAQHHAGYAKSAEGLQSKLKVSLLLELHAP